MSVPKKVKDYLDKKNATYEEVVHKTVFTAYDASQTLKKELKEIAKNLLVQVDKTYALVIVPANKRLDLQKLKKVLGAKKITIPNEKVMVKVLKIKPGAISSFGRLHRLETLVDKAMLKTKQAVFSTGSFTDSVLMKVKDFILLEEAKLIDIAAKGDYQIPKKVKKQMRQVKVQIKVRPKKLKKNLKKRATAKNNSRRKK